MNKLILGGFALAISAMFTACSDDSSSASTSSKSIEIKEKTIKGVSQKGPFVKGATVKIYELEDESFAQTGKNFKGDITNDKGEFSVKSVSLASQYALLEANGYYRDEITGKKSNGTITLNAFSDLSNRENVNVNILTHLEYPRTITLIESGKTPEEAKEQAEKEIFEAFGFDEKTSKFEDLSIFNDKVLLAISILLSGNRDAADLTELLSDISEDIAKDGKWDKEKTKKAVATEASKLDMKEIRNNIEKWDISSSIPEFENYVNIFWSNTFGFEKCTKKNQKEIDSYATSSKKNEYYICDETFWRPATKIEYNTYKSSKPSDGDLEEGSVDEGSFFVYEGDSWREAKEKEVELQKGCTEKQIGKTEGDYICLANGWKMVNEDLKGLTCEEGKTVKGIESNMLYKCKGNVFSRVSDFQTWFGTSGTSKLDSKYNSDTRWFVESDGKSHIEWPIAIPKKSSEDSLDAIIQKCEGLCGKAILKNDDIAFDPYVNIEFELTTKQKDVSEMGGICIAYTSQIAPSVSLIVEGTEDYPFYKMKKSPEEVNVVQIPWSSFQQNGWGKEISSEDVFNSSIKLAFTLQAKKGTNADFNIKAIGPYMGDCDLYDVAK